MRQTRQHVAAEMVGAQGMVPAAQWPQHRGKVLPQRVHPSERPEQREAGDGQHHGPADPRPGRTTPRARMQIAQQRREA
ncbi:hypothetical protein RQ734_19035 [Roseomonas mucosa]|uniref:hypothetical protein n=1 Tax=Roseomonas mucosa TaxID=207340 RepID=UPI0028CBFC0F|nr:hypothetical protein [Roseomonas mucosa]MDT8278172.1 hypothetical protein [Roseomonas mucosa]